MLLVFNVDNRELRTMNAGDISRCMEYADEVARVFGTGRDGQRGRAWVARFQFMAAKLGYARAKDVRVCTCCTLNLCHSPECGLVRFTAKHPESVKLPVDIEELDDLPIINVPYEWPGITRMYENPWRKVLDAYLTPCKIVDDERNVRFIVHDIPESDPDVVAFTGNAYGE